MSTGQILLLGALAGVTIFLGLPIGRLHDVAPRRFKAFLSAIATGILLFLLWDVLSAASSRSRRRSNASRLGHVHAGYAALALRRLRASA